MRVELSSPVAAPVDREYASLPGVRSLVWCASEVEQ